MSSLSSKMKGWRFYYKKLGHLLENNFRKYRAYLIPKCYVRYSSAVVVPKFEGTLVSVVDLTTTEMLTDSGRYFQGFVKGLLDAGHTVYLVKRLWLYTELRKKVHSKSLMTSGEIKFIDKKILVKNAEEIDYLWHDALVPSNGVKKAKKMVRLRISSHPQTDAVWMPYQAHPSLSGLIPLAKSDAEKSRRFGVAFIGNVTKSYESDFVRSHGVMTRVHIFKTLMSELPNAVYYENFDGAEEMSSEEKSSVFLPKYDKHAGKSVGRVPSDTYLSLLREIDFILCAPGTFMPFAHNVIEAMSQGCVPIIEYNKFFLPELQNELNCLVFNDEISLIKAVDKALAMNDLERVKMRKEVSKYYGDHLEFRSFLTQLDRREESASCFYYG